MLSSVASYLFGSTQPEDQETRVELSTKQADDQDDWLIVDLPDKTTCATAKLKEHSRTTRQKSSNSNSDSETDSVVRSPSLSPSTSGSASPVGHSRYCIRTNIGFHESWILTPPPCFTAGGTQSSEVEMTPLENLLIEHPSMSVYNSQGLSGSAGEESDLSESSNDSISKVRARRGLRPRNNKDLVMRHPPRRPQAIAARCGILAQVDSVRNSQRTKRQQDSKRFTRSSLEKINKTMHKNTKKFTHKNRLQVPSARTNFKQVQH